MTSSGLIPNRSAVTRVALEPWRALGKLTAPNQRKSINKKRFPHGAHEESILLTRQLRETGAWQFRALTSYQSARAFDVIVPESSVDFIRTVESIIRPTRSILEGTPDAGLPPKLTIPTNASIQLHRIGWAFELRKGTKGRPDRLSPISDQFNGLFGIRNGNFTHVQLGRNMLFNAIEPASDLTLQPDLIVRFAHPDLGNLEAIVYKTSGTRIFDEFRGFLTIGQQSQDGTGGSSMSFDLDNYEREQVLFKGRSPRGRMTVDYMRHMSMTVAGPAKVPGFLGGESEVTASVDFDLSSAYPILVDPVAAKPAESHTTST